MSDASFLRRITLWPRAARLRFDTSIARNRRDQAFSLVGEHLCADAEREAPDRMPGPMGRALETRQAMRALEAAQRASFHQDRVDFARLAGGVKVLVVLRGLLARGVHRVERRTLGREAHALYTELGTLKAEALAQSQATWATAELKAHVRDVVNRAERLTRARAELLAPFGGHALPGWMHAVARELVELVRAVVRELHSRMVPRLAGLVGMVVGGWVAHSFTTSKWHGFLGSLGLREGGPRVVSAQTYARLEFWLPLLAAALCGYLMNRAVAWVHRRYQPPALPAAAASERTVLNAVTTGIDPS